jgi:aryl-alcohol dehydrogenase-like predicted oxidoreductase
VEYRDIAGSGLVVSTVGVGCNNFGIRCDLEQTRAVVDAALDAGVTLFDTAEVYGNGGGSETLLGRALGSRRKDAVIATKFGKKDASGRRYGGSRRYIMEAVEGSLARLQTDWIDLYQQHWPDPDVPLDETLRALEDLVQQGKVRYLGASNFDAARIREVDEIARRTGVHRCVTMQSEYSLLERGIERDVLPAIAARGMGLLPYYPLASGLLTGKYARDRVPEGSRLATPRPNEQPFIANPDWATIEALEAFARSRGHTMLDLAFGWLLAQPAVASVIAGATRPEQIALNAGAASWQLDAEELATVDAITRRGKSATQGRDPGS